MFEDPNRCHVDIGVDDVDEAIEQVVALGGRLKKEPSIYPRPGSFPGKSPVIDWSVMLDPFGNEFCLVSDLSPEEVSAVETATDATTDQEYRAAAGRSRLGREYS